MPNLAPPAAVPTRDSRRQVWLAGALLALATLVAYANSFHGPFVFDDKPAILENPTIRQLWPLTSVLSPPPVGSSVTGRPLVNLSLALNYAVSGEAVWSYHAVNLLIHLLAGLALFGLVRRTLGLPVIPARLRSAALPVSAVAAALWLVHPLQTESVTSVIQRTESLVGLFYLLTLYGFVRCLGASRPAGWQVLAVIACLLGMAAKEVMVTAPLVVLLYDRTFAAGSLREAWRRRRGFYLGLAGTWLLLAALVLGGGGTRGEAAGFGLGVTPWTYALTQCRAVVLYLKLAAWPHPLVLDYGSGVVRQMTQALPHALLLLALLAGTAWAWIRRPLAGFAAVVFFVILAPSSSVVPLVSQTVAEHRMYLPLAALAVLVTSMGYLRFGRGALVAGGMVALGFIGLTLARNRTYRTELALWRDTVAHVPENARAQINLAECLILLGQPAEALGPAEAAVRLRPEYPEAQSNLGIALAQVGRADEALAHGIKAVQLQPKGWRAQATLGAMLFQLGRWGEAIEHLETSLRLAPPQADATRVHSNLGVALLQAGRASEAVTQFETVVRTSPNQVEAHYSLAVALGSCERLPEAAREMETVLRLKPDYAEARNALESIRAELNGKK